MSRMSLRRLVARVGVATLAVAVPVSIAPAPASAAAPADLFFSEYVEGGSYNKAVEIYNGTGATVDLTAGDYEVDIYFNGSASVGRSIALSGSVTSGDVFVLASSPSSSPSDPVLVAAADQIDNSTSWFNGDDAVVLRKGTTILDVIGQIGVDPGTEWGSGLTSTADNTLRRKADVCTGDPDGTDPFDPAVQWDGFAKDTFDGLGSHTASCGGGTPTDTAPSVVSIDPADGSDAAPGSSATVQFSEAVDLAAGAISLECGTDVVAFSLGGGPTTYTVDPNQDLPDGESCTLTVHADLVTDTDTIDPPDNLVADSTSTFTVVDVCTADYTHIYDIQGSGPAAAITGAVTTKGIVVGDYEGPSPALRGFYLQDANGDDNPATSDGIFVFNGNNDSVSLGDEVVVSGFAGEFQDQTQISGVSVIHECGTGTVAPTGVTLPVPSADYFERFEGMLVSFPQELSVTEIYQLGRYGQVTMSSGGRLQQPTNVVAPGPEANALQAANDLNQVIFDDGDNAQNADPIVFGRGGHPLSASNTLRGGDTATGTVGVMTYTWGGYRTNPNAFRVRPVNALDGHVLFEAANPRPDGPPEVGGDVTVAGMNLLNYFTTLDTGGNNCTGGLTGPPMECRGANSQLELDRQTAKTVAAITKVNADIVGINEIENDGYGSGSTIDYLVEQLNAATAPGTYAYLDVDDLTGQVDALGNDAIKVATIYQPAAVTPVGTTAALNSEAFINGGDSSARNRASLAQAWRSTATGGIFITDVNHLKSKGSECETGDTGDGQGNCAIVRTTAVRTLMEWLATDPTGTGDQDVLLIGDYNSYAKETPITTLEEGGFTNLIAHYQGEDAYSYVFDGQWGYLDQALASETLAGQVTGAADYHINADEPSVLDYNTDFKSDDQIESLYAPDEFRVSDHDPVLIGISPNPSFDTQGIEAPASKNQPVKAGATLPIKVTFTAADGSLATDISPEVTISLDGQVVATGTMTLVDGTYQYNLRTGTLPDPSGSYTITVLVPWNGQTVTGSFTLRP